MTAIVPRWEWRTFGSSFGPEVDALGERASDPPVESEELYFLAGPNQNVKVRDDLIDIKLLREVDADGLERWEPVMKEGFPLSADQAPRVLEALGLSPPTFEREAYTLDQFLGEVLEPSGAIRVVAIRKRRTRFTVGGCMGELADVEAEGRSVRTFAVESEDATAVISAVRELGLGSYVNTSYPRGLGALLDDVPPRFAVIDVGTNSVKFHVGERGADGTWRPVVDRAEMTRLGEGLRERGEISREAMARTAEAVAGMVDEARSERARAIVGVGTAGLRIANNRDEVLEAIRTRAGIAIDVISGEEEGRLAYVAVRAGLGSVEGSLVVFDTGGGSSQFTFGHGEQVDERFSVEVGAVRYTEGFALDRAVGPDALREALEAISTDLARIDGRPPPDALVAMGGAVTNITAVKLGLAEYDADLVQGATLDRDEIDRQIELYRSRDAEDRRTIVGLQPKRAEVILAGACIVRTVMEKLGQLQVTVSDRGLRHGVLMDRFGA